MEQILQILSSKVTMVRSDNSVNRECLWLDLPMDHRKMLYNHCASGILEASKKDPALTDLRFLQLSAGHSQTNLSGEFCLSFKTICVLHPNPPVAVFSVSAVRQLLPLKRMDFVLVRRMPGR